MGMADFLHAAMTCPGQKVRTPGCHPK